MTRYLYKEKMKRMPVGSKYLEHSRQSEFLFRAQVTKEGMAGVCVT